jgi:hypothetical protein
LLPLYKDEDMRMRRMLSSSVTAWRRSPTVAPLSGGMITIAYCPTIHCRARDSCGDGTAGYRWTSRVDQVESCIVIVGVDHRVNDRFCPEGRSPSPTAPLSAMHARGLAATPQTDDDGRRAQTTMSRGHANNVD